MSRRARGRRYIIAAAVAAVILVVVQPILPVAFPAVAGFGAYQVLSTVTFWLGIPTVGALLSVGLLLIELDKPSQENNRSDS